MTFNYSQPLTQQQYVNTLVNFITGQEGPGPKVYLDGVGVATIGYGYTFNRTNNVGLWQAAEISLSSTEITLLQAIDNATTTAQKNQLALTFKRQVSATEAKSLLLQTYPEYEGPANALGMPLSLERVAFVSLTYNRGVGAVNKRMQAFVSAIQNENRAEAWYQIRYNSFTASGLENPGLPKRRYLESGMFGLYGDQTKMTPPEILKKPEIFIACSPCIVQR